MDFSNLYQLDQSIFIFKGCCVAVFIFIQNFKSAFCKQIVETLIRRRVLRRRIWVCTVCLCPTKRMLGLYGLKELKVNGPFTQKLQENYQFHKEIIGKQPMD